MPVWLRRSLIALAVLVALLVAAAAWLVASFDATRTKGLLIDWMRDNKQRTLAIDGPIGLSVFPRLELSLAGVRLSEHRRADEFLAIDKASLAVQVMPLLSKQIAIDRVAADGVRVVYTRDAQGKRNIDDLLAPAAPAQPAPTTESGAPALRFDVSAVELANLQATVKDQIAGIDGRFVVKQLSTGRLADGTQSPLRFVGQAQLAKPAVHAEVDLAAKLKLALPAGAPASVALEELKVALKGEGFDVKKLDAQLAGASLAYDGASGALAAQKLDVTLSGERLGMALKDTRLTLASLGYEPAQRKLQLDALVLDLKGARGQDAIQARLDWPKLAVAGDALQGSALKGSASVKGPAQSLQMDFASQAPSGSFERIKVPGVKLAVNGSGAGRTVKGEAATDLTLVPKPLAVALDALKLNLAFTDPAIPPVNLAVQGQARATAQDAAWQLDGSINQQKFNAGGKADLSKPVPRVVADARFDALDLTRFVTPAGAKPGAAPPPPTGGGKPAPIDLGGLKAIDGSFKLLAGTLVYPPYRVNDAVVQATLDNGLLRVHQLSGKAWSGRFNLQATAQSANDLNAQRITAKLDASDVDIAQLLSDVAQFKKLEGRGKVTADIATRGANVDAFKQQLAGKAAMQLRDGAVRGINLAKVLRQYKSAVTLDKDAVQKASAEEKTDFSEITASFDIADGVARSKDLDAKSPFLRVGGEGAIDLGKSRIDYLVRATVADTSKGQGGAELEALRGVTVPVQLVGPFEAVDYKVQWSAVSADLLKAAAKKQLNERAKGVLGGLLGGGAAEQAASGASAPAPTPKQQARDKAKEELKKLFGR